MKALFSYPLMLEGSLENIKSSVMYGDDRIVLEHVELFNSLALPFMFVGVHKKLVHLTYVSSKKHDLEKSIQIVSDVKLFQFTSPSPVTTSALQPLTFIIDSPIARIELVKLADVVWRLDVAQQRYVVVKDRSGLYKGSYDV